MKNNKHNLKVGDTVYLIINKEPSPTKITKVGNKFFTIDHHYHSRTKFFIDTLEEDYTYVSPIKIYLNYQPIITK